MFKDDAKEAAPLARRVLNALLQFAPTRGRPGADLRYAIGDFNVHAEQLIRSNQAGDPLAKIFELAINTGITLAQMKAVRAQAVKESPKLLGAVLIQNSLIDFTLATESRILAKTTFTSRQDVEAMRLEMNDAFAPMEEIAADDMDQATFQALTGLHAAVSFFLIETARPLPRLLKYSFAAIQSTLVTAQRLYYDAGRADELRKENKNVHPAFMLNAGVALSK